MRPDDSERLLGSWYKGFQRRLEIDEQILPNAERAAFCIVLRPRWLSLRVDSNAKELPVNLRSPHRAQTWSISILSVARRRSRMLTKENTRSFFTIGENG